MQSAPLQTLDIHAGTIVKFCKYFDSAEDSIEGQTRLWKNQALARPAERNKWASRASMETYSVETGTHPDPPHSMPTLHPAKHSRAGMSRTDAGSTAATLMRDPRTYRHVCRAAINLYNTNF